MDDKADEISLKEESQDYAFQALSGVRESISLGKRQSNQITYEAALDVIHDLDPEAYDRFVELLTKRNKSEDVRFYIEQAEALSTDEKPVLPIDLIQRDLAEIELALAKKKTKGNALLKRKISLIAAIEYFKPRKVSEHKILNRDFYLSSVNVPDALKIYNDEKFVDYKLSDDRFLRLRLLHPDKEEEILGSDLIYEQFDFAKERVRFVHIQYKLWGKNGLYFSQGNMKAQVDKVCSNLCNESYCLSPEGGNSGTGYRFPFCSGFLRPTDKQLDNGKDMTSTGLHMPICFVQRLSSDPDVKRISKADARNSGVSHTVFNELFVNGFIGSRWMPIAELEQFYADRAIDDHINSIRVHAQEVQIELESKKVVKKGE